MMNRKGIGGVLVLGELGQVLGIFTERDILRRVVAAGLDAAVTRVGDVATPDVVTVQVTTSVEECSALMSTRRIRHIPVMDGDRLKGVVTSGDVLAFRVAESETTLEHMSHYLYDTR
jgi:CBS domain-containing protein